MGGNTFYLRNRQEAARAQVEIVRGSFETASHDLPKDGSAAGAMRCIIKGCRPVRHYHCANTQKEPGPVDVSPAMSRGESLDMTFCDAGWNSAERSPLGRL